MNKVKFLIVAFAVVCFALSQAAEVQVPGTVQNVRIVQDPDQPTYQFAPMLSNQKSLGSAIGTFEIGPTPIEINRRCSLPGELQQCIDYCHAAGGIRKVPEQGWNPWDPRVLSARITPVRPPLFTPYLAVYSCDVRTIGGHMTLVCQCFDPGNVT